MRYVLRTTFLAFFLTCLIALPQGAWARSGPDSFADLAEKLLPAVVNISTTQTITQGQDFPEFDFQLPEGSPFNDFFEEFKKQHDRMDKGSKKRTSKATSLGSGFIIDPSGYVVTNNHVIQDADEITVILHDDTNLTAKLIGRDPKTDLAVLKVEPKKPLTAVSFGDSDAVRVGDWILAIGNPYGLGGTVTTGIISARARDINSGPYDDFLQTDAPINRGNSGGPMFNMAGEVIGINTAIYSPTGGSVGIGFAIPSSMARNIIEQLKTTGTTERGWLGVRIQAVTQEIADGLGLGTARGALVANITEGGPADKAKFKTGDVIVS
ncbi:MAG: trypsin-like peptidase domain-containing protein, partial [Bdellovibrionales bacterium]